MNYAQIKNELEQIKDYSKMETWLTRANHAFPYKGKFYHVEDAEQQEDELHVLVFDICKKTKSHTVIINKDTYIDWAVKSGYTEFHTDRRDHTGEHVEDHWTVDREEWFEDNFNDKDMLAGFLMEQKEIEFQQEEVTIPGAPLWDYIGGLLNKAAL